MQDSSPSVSASTHYRYLHANRKADLPQFLHFKSEFENYLSPQKISKIKQVYQHGVCGKNQQKHTVVVDRIGNIKIHELSKVFEDDDLVHYTSQRLLALSERMAEREQVVWIVDLSGKIMQLASKRILEWLQRIIANLQKYFPELLHRLVFVNTPMLFDTIWAKLTPLLAKQTLEKVVLLGDDLSSLLEYAEPSLLPDFLGGDVPEQNFLDENQQKPKPFEDSSSSEEEVDFSSLKQALSGLKFGGSSVQSVSQTPLNTEADDK